MSALPILRAEPPLTPESPETFSRHGHSKWPVVGVVILVLGGAAGLLVTGHPLRDALLCAAGIAMIAGQVARRLVADAGPLPTIIVAGAVAAFGVLAYISGYNLTEATAGAGFGGLLAGEIAGRVFPNVPRPWRGV